MKKKKKTHTFSSSKPIFGQFMVSWGIFFIHFHLRFLFFIIKILNHFNIQFLEILMFF